MLIRLTKVRTTFAQNCREQMRISAEQEQSQVCDGAFAWLPILFMRVWAGLLKRVP